MMTEIHTRDLRALLADLNGLRHTGAAIINRAVVIRELATRED